MAERVRKPEWLKINIGANERYTETKRIVFAVVADARIWENVGEKVPPHL